jgi:broad specificity phosphatase PhoE
MSRFILIRHGESVWNGERRIQGSRDPTLSERGRQQADLLVRHLHTLVTRPVVAVYTSPLQRAAETAERIAHAMHLPVIRESDLREICLGEWEGMTVAEIRDAFPGRYEKWLEDPVAFPVPGGETVVAFGRRVQGSLERMQQAHPGSDMLIVSHGGVIKALLCFALGLDIRYLFRLKQDNTAVNQVDLGGQVRRVLLMNDTCHLNDGRGILGEGQVLPDAAEVVDPAF